MRHSLAIVIAFCLSACGLLPEVKEETAGWSASKLYSEAKGDLNDGNYERAIKLYETLEARYPYGRYAQQAQLEIGYAYYKSGETAQAVAAADRFIKLHPNHVHVDYAFYLKGLANFNEDLGFMGRLGGQDMTERDPKAAKEAFQAFKDLAARYPNSKYAADSEGRMRYLLNALAFHEVHVASYYLRRGAYVAAANRAQYGVITYPQAPATEEALLIMVKAYDALGMTELRDDSERVLKLNFPNSKYLAGPVAQGKQWWKVW
jgi:outer membrane protein assembly factor BamD